MDISRRNLILGAGGTAALVGIGGAWRVTRMPERANAPWILDKTAPTDVRLDAFRHAILAPNPHNRQPWLIQMEGNDSAILTCDLAKRLPETDPFDRQITIGFGTFIELAIIAAAQRGFRIDVAPFPEGASEPRLDKRPVARLRFVPDTKIVPDPLYSAITKRRTNRSVYETTTLSLQESAILRTDGAQVSVNPEQLAQMRSITVDAISREMMTHKAHMESVRLMRIGHHEVDATPDGLSLTGPMIETTRLIGITTRESIADPKNSAFKIGLDGLRESYGSVPAALWITSPSNARADQLEAGRLYARTHLRATNMGLSMHPMSQSLQEYPEMAPYFAAIHMLLGVSGVNRIQMLARVGRSPNVAAAARWPLETHMKT